MKHFDEISPRERVNRWQHARDVLERLTPHQRKKHFDMSAWGKATQCGTVACAAGFCGLNSWFRKQGFRMDLVPTQLKVDKKYIDNALSTDTFYVEDGGRYFEGDGATLTVYITKISSVEDFFGPGAVRIFLNPSRRSVATVIREIKEHIETL